jgi:hypothetical protein
MRLVTEDKHQDGILQKRILSSGKYDSSVSKETLSERHRCQKLLWNLI